MIEKFDLSYLNLSSIKFLIEKIDIREHGLVKNGGSSYNYGAPILEYPGMLGIKKIIEKHMPSELKLINSWFNITHPGGDLKPHFHGESIISGAFYVHAGKNSVPLIFEKEKVYPKPGLLVLFSSDLVHYTEPEKEKRIVISFNTDYK